MSSATSSMQSNMARMSDLQQRQQNSYRTNHPANQAQGVMSQQLGMSQRPEPLYMRDPITDSLIMIGPGGIRLNAANNTIQCGTPIKKEVSMFKEVKNDLSQFIRGHKQLIYTVVALYLIDHWMFEGKFKAKLQEIVGKLVKKAENELDAIGGSHESAK